MTDRSHRESRADLAAYLLGHQDPEEQAAFEAQMAADPELRAEAQELEPVVEALDLVDPDRLPSAPPPVPPADLVDRTVQRVGWVAAADASQRRRNRRWRILAGVAAVGVAAAAIVGVLVLPDGGGGDHREEFALAPEGVEAAYELEPTADGTRVTLYVDGLEQDATYWLWLTDDDGNRRDAGVWHGDPGGQPVTFDTEIAMDDADRVWVTDDAAGNSVVLDELR
jgi:anti-sigma-K factor RskA